MAKRKRSGAHPPAVDPAIPTSVVSITKTPQAASRNNKRRTQPASTKVDVNPDTNLKIEDGKSALRASPDAEKLEKPRRNGSVPAVKGKRLTKVPATPKPKTEPDVSDSSLSDLSDMDEKPVAVKSNGVSKKITPTKENILGSGDPEADEVEDADPEELKEAVTRPPPVNSSYLPLPWKGRLGYCCLNTYLRAASPPIFSSRTCRIASILEHRHPLKDPSQPEHATKNRPDKDQPADIARGQAYVEALGLANARDIPKMLRWNHRYGIRFFRLSSEMFPFASHDVYGYKLAPFASEVLAEAGQVAAELGHRLTTHPGQFTQLGSPRSEVITASLRDLDYHCELLDLLRLPPQQDRDAVMILHMGGIFGDKAATIERFKENYVKLPENVKRRLVLENDDMCYSVHDILPVCEELNIPMVLDFHHHNIVFDAEQIREGTHDIMDLYPRILATWKKKNITPKMHYSEPTPQAITARQRRKHNPRPATLPPCPADMDLMIEAKDKEQAVFELMRTFKLPGWDTFNDIVPYSRIDENKAWKPPKKKKTPKKKKNAEEDDVTLEEPEPQPPPIVPDNEVSMGGSEGRVYWPRGMEEWLRPKKREVKPRDPEKAKSTAEKAAQRRAEKAAWQAAREASAEVGTTGQSVSAASISGSDTGDVPSVEIEKTKSVYDKAKTSKVKPVRAPKSAKTTKKAKVVPTPSESDHDDEDDEDDDVDMPDLTDAEEEVSATKKSRTKLPSLGRRQSGRGAKQRTVNYNEAEDEEA